MLALKIFNQNFNKFLAIFLIFSIYIFTSYGWQELKRDNSCLKCHKGIENIRPLDSKMMKEIFKISEKAGYKGNDCIVCHGGNPDAKKLKEFHRGTVSYFLKNEGPKDFYPDPSSPWINKNTCGICHKVQVETQYSSLMFTEAGKIQGSLWGFGGLEGYKHEIGNYNVKESEIHKKIGTETYRKYMKELRKKEPQVFPIKMKQLAPAPNPKDVEKNPQLAVYTYLRTECLRCHTGVKGRQKRGDYRGMGCSACHIPYSNEGFYEGKDKTIPKDERGHMLVHSIQGTRDTKVKIHGIEYSGIPVETCTTCHDRGKRIGTSYQGLMETSYKSPFLENGSDQPKLHTKHYLHLKEDIHLKKGMLCQDCHTSVDVHGDGLLAGTTLAPVEIECQDCHGTPTKYPWELPIGYSDEYSEKEKVGKPRGVLSELPKYLKQGKVYDAKDGYLLTARGNPFGNVVKDGDEVIVHTAGGKDLRLKPLKKLNREGKLSKEGYVSMVLISKHTERMECYTCHSTWAPQCYGCHIKIDYSSEEKHPDWIAMGNAVDIHGLTADARGEFDKFLISGKVTETRSYLRWENPPLVQNGEGRISPAIPGCQTTITVIGKDGKPIILNKIFRIPNVEGAGKKGQKAIDISPVQPHTTQKEARSCESCHNNPVAIGYGIGGGKLYSNPSIPYVVELSTADGKVLPKKHITQINSIPELNHDWSRFIDEQGRQLQTVGHHFKLSRPLNYKERSLLDRRGVCLSCHKTIPNQDLAVSLLTHVRETANIEIDNDKHKSILSKLLIIGAWVQVGGALFGALFITFIIWKIRRKKKRQIRW